MSSESYDPLEAFSLQARDSAAALVSDLTQQLKAGELDTFRQQDVVMAVADLGRVAALQADPETVLRYADILSNLDVGSSGVYHQAELYYLAASEGSLEGSEKLHMLLAKEKAETEARKASPPTGSFRYTLASPALDRIVEVAVNRDLPVEGWVEPYAIDDNHISHLQLVYYGRSRLDGKTPSDYARAQRDKVVADYLEGNLDSTFAHDTTNLLLAFVEDPQTKLDIVDTFQRLDDVQLTYPAYQAIVQVAITAMEEPGLSDEAIDRFTATEERCRALLVENGLDPYLAIEQKRNFLLAKAWRESDNPASVVAVLDTLTSSLLSQDIPETDTSKGLEYVLRNKEFVVKQRDTLLAQFAQLAAKQGKLAAAKQFLDQVTAANEFVLEPVLMQAKTVDDLNMLRPDELTLMTMPELVDLFPLEEARLASDADAVSALVQQFARQAHEAGDDTELALHCEQRILRGFEILEAQNPAALEALIQTLLDPDAIQTTEYTKTIAFNKQMETGNPAGFEGAYEQAGQESEPRRLDRYARLAIRSIKAAHKNQTI
jgi:hypothetical protein